MDVGYAVALLKGARDAFAFLTQALDLRHSALDDERKLVESILREIEGYGEDLATGQSAGAEIELDVLGVIDGEMIID